MPKIDAKKVTMNMPMAPNADVLAASGSSRPPTKKDCVERRTPTQSCDCVIKGKGTERVIR